MLDSNKLYHLIPILDIIDCREFVSNVDTSNRSVFEDKIPNFEVLGGHKSTSLLPNVLDHDGDTESLVPRPVRQLALPPTVGDGETLGAFLYAVSALVTHHTGQEIPV